VSIFPGSPAGLVLEIDIGQRLAVVVPHDEAGAFSSPTRPRRREAATSIHIDASMLATCQMAKKINRNRVSSHPSLYVATPKMIITKISQNA
jgi:hypothetical protein